LKVADIEAKRLKTVEKAEKARQKALYGNLSFTKAYLEGVD